MLNVLVAVTDELEPPEKPDAVINVVDFVIVSFPAVPTTLCVSISDPGEVAVAFTSSLLFKIIASSSAVDHLLSNKSKNEAY